MMHSTSLTASTTPNVFPNASCWSSERWTALPSAASGTYIPLSSYIDDFCTTESDISVLPGFPLARNWTDGKHTIEIVAEVDTSQSKCRESTISTTDLLCYTYLNKIVDTCDFEHTEDSQHGSTVTDGCVVWSLGEFLTFLCQLPSTMQSY